MYFIYRKILDFVLVIFLICQHLDAKLCDEGKIYLTDINYDLIEASINTEFRENGNPGFFNLEEIKSDAKRSLKIKRTYEAKGNSGAILIKILKS